MFERLDDDTECDGLVPERAPDPVDVAWDAPADATCAGGSSDGTGHVAVAARTDDGGEWQVFAPDGSAKERFAAWPLVPGPEGWHGLTVDPRVNLGTRVTHQAYSPEGAPLAAGPANSDPDAMLSDRWALAQDPKGGCFTLVGEVDQSHNHWTRLEAQRFDDAGQPHWQENLAFGGNGEHSFQFVGAGVSALGEALAIWQDSAWVDVTWLDADGGTAAAATRPERYADLVGSSEFRPYQVELVPLLDGSLAVRADGVFRRIYPHLATQTGPLPAWLAARASSSLRFTRGNRGYAVFPPAGQAAPACDQAIELLAPSGRLCGRVTLAGDGNACTTGAVDQGWDGTVVQQRESTGCAWRFWPGLLAK